MYVLTILGPIICNDDYLPVYSKNAMAAKHNPIKSIENGERDRKY